MMIAIPNMGMPQTCGECELRAFDEWEDEYCVILRDDILVPYERMLDCPIIEIVTCGECKWSKTYYVKADNSTRLCCDNYSGLDKDVDPSDFCPYGERRDDEHMD